MVGGVVVEGASVAPAPACWAKPELAPLVIASNATTAEPARSRCFIPPVPGLSSLKSRTRRCKATFRMSQLAPARKNCSKTRVNGPHGLSLGAAHLARTCSVDATI